MSNAVSALPGAISKGTIEVAEVGLIGMVTIRADLISDPNTAAIYTALGVPVPERRQITAGGEDRLLWMSPDELLLVCPHDQAASRVGALSAALSGQHSLVVDVSDARAMFRLKGEARAIRETLAKLTPADMRASVLPVGEVRRTRIAQVAAAFWFDAEDAASVVCFRSVADYAFKLLSKAAAPGSEVGYF